MELFSVRTTVTEYRGYRDVRFAWFSSDRKVPLVPYAVAIHGYDPSPDLFYAKMAVDELFSRAEAEALKAYLDEHHGREGATEIEEYRLPIPNNLMGYGAVPAGGGPDFYLLWQEPAYVLPFKVEGFFDLRGYERVDGRENIAEYSGRLLVTSDRCVILVGVEAERLLAKYPAWTSEQELAEVERLACEGL